MWKSKKPEKKIENINTTNLAEDMTENRPGTNLHIRSYKFRRSLSWEDIVAEENERNRRLREQPTGLPEDDISMIGEIEGEDGSADKAYLLPDVFKKNAHWEDDNRLEEKPYLEVVVETPVVGSTEAMDKDNDPGHTSVVLDFTAKDHANKKRRAHIHVGFHPRAGAGVAGMEEALLKRTDYPGAVQDDGDTLSSAGVRRRFPVEPDKLTGAIEVMDKYDTGMPYNLIYNNCTTFVANVAKKASITGADDIFQETEWKFGAQAKAKMWALHTFGNALGAVKNQSRTMSSLTKKRNLKEYDKMRLSKDELERYRQSLAEKRGDKNSYKGYSPSDVATKLLANDYAGSFVIPNTVEEPEGEVDESYLVQKKQLLHTMSKLNDFMPDDQSARMPLPATFISEVTRSATAKYFSPWRKQIRKEKGWEQPFGPPDVHTAVNKISMLLANARVYGQRLIAANANMLGNRDKRASINEDIFKTLEAIQDEADKASALLDETDAPNSFKDYMSAWSEDVTHELPEELTRLANEADQQPELNEAEEAVKPLYVELTPGVPARQYSDQELIALGELYPNDPIIGLLLKDIKAKLHKLKNNLNGEQSQSALRAKSLIGYMDRGVVLKILQTISGIDIDSSYNMLVSQLTKENRLKAQSSWEKLDEKNYEGTKKIEKHLSGSDMINVIPELLNRTIAYAANKRKMSYDELYKEILENAQDATAMRDATSLRDTMLGMLSDSKHEILDEIRKTVPTKPRTVALTTDEIKTPLEPIEKFLQQQLLLVMSKDIPRRQEIALAFARDALSRRIPIFVKEDQDRVEQALRQEEYDKRIAELKDRKLTGDDKSNEYDKQNAEWSNINKEYDDIQRKVIDSIAKDYNQKKKDDNQKKKLSIDSKDATLDANFINGALSAFKVSASDGTFIPYYATNVVAKPYAEQFTKCLQNALALLKTTELVSSKWDKSKMYCIMEYLRQNTNLDNLFV